MCEDLDRRKGAPGRAAAEALDTVEPRINLSLIRLAYMAHQPDRKLRQDIADEIARVERMKGF